MARCQDSAQPVAPALDGAAIILADFFAGCGGTSRGFADVGIKPVVAVEGDPDAAASYRRNFSEAEVLERDIRDVRTDDFADTLALSDGAIRLFAGCAPCQPFAGHRNGHSVKAPGFNLLLEFLRFVEEFRPEIMFVENVPGMRRSSDALAEFEKKIRPLGYRCSSGIVSSADYGVPQARRRFVLVASRLDKIELPLPAHGDGIPLPYVTVRDAIEDLPGVAARSALTLAPTVAAGLPSAALAHGRNLEQLVSCEPEVVRGVRSSRVELVVSASAARPCRCRCVGWRDGG